MQASYISAVLQKAAQAPALAGIYIHSVRICAVRDWTHEPILTILWSMPDHSAAIDAPAMSLPGVSAIIISRPSDTAIELQRALASPAEMEDAVIQAAWTLGAWDMCRLETAPLARGRSWSDPGCGIGTSFGHSDYVIAGQSLIVGDSAHERVCEIAAADGYITWRFVPLCLATPIARRRWGSKDSTLQPDCTRIGEPGPHRGKWWHPTEPLTGNEHQYQLGRGNHGNRSKAGKERRA